MWSIRGFARSVMTGLLRCWVTRLLSTPATQYPSNPYSTAIDATEPPGVILPWRHNETLSMRAPAPGRGPRRVRGEPPADPHAARQRSRRSGRPDHLHLPGVELQPGHRPPRPPIASGWPLRLVRRISAMELRRVGR